MKKLLLSILFIFPFIGLSDTVINPSDLSEHKVKEKNLDQLVDKNLFSAMLPLSMKKEMANILKGNPFSKMSSGDIKSILVGSFEGHKIGEFFKNNPRIVDTMIIWLRDKEALPKFISIVNKPEKLKIYSGIFIAVFIITFLINLKNSEKGILGRLFRKLCLVIGGTTINFAAFYIIFLDELGPTVRILKGAFF